MCFGLSMRNSNSFENPYYNNNFENFWESVSNFVENINNFILKAITILSIVLVANTTSKALREGLKFLNTSYLRAAIRDAIQKNSKNNIKPEGHVVYVIYEIVMCDVWYVGRTNNFDRRYKEHNKNWFFGLDGFEMVPIVSGLTKQNARALEQILISVYSIDGIENQINSIARNNWGKFTKNFIRMHFLILSGFMEE